MPSETYEIAPGQSADGTKWWAVTAYDATGTCLGGDAHWLREDLAIRVKGAYERGEIRHGDTAAALAYNEGH